jgi:hypothetical protein
MKWHRRSQLPAGLGQPASTLLLANPVWPFEVVASLLRNRGYTGWTARSHEEARRHLNARDRRIDILVASTSTGDEDDLQLVFEVGSTRPELRVLVLLDLERCAAPVVIVWRLARLPNTASIIELAASPERIVARIEALLTRPAPLPYPAPVDRVSQAAGPGRALRG